MLRFRIWQNVALVALLLAGCGSGVILTPLEKAQALLREGQYEAAVTACDEAISVDPNHAAAYLCRGKAYLLLSNTDRAITDFDEAIRLAPQEPENYFERAAAYKIAGNMKKAVADESQGRKLDPNYAQAFLFQPDAGDDDLLNIPDVPEVPKGKRSKMRAADGTLPPTAESIARGDNVRGMLDPAMDDEEEDIDGTDSAINAFRQKPRSMLRQGLGSASEQSTTVRDVYGQPLVIESRTQTEELLGIHLPKPGDPPETRAQRSGPGQQNSDPQFGRFASRDGLPESREGLSDLSSVPRLTHPVTSTAIGPPVQGAGAGYGSPRDGQVRNGIAELPANYPPHSPYVNPRMRTTGVQEPVAGDLPPRLNPYGGLPYSPAQSNAAGGGLSNGGSSFRPTSPYSTPIPAGGRRDVSVAPQAPPINNPQDDVVSP